MVVWYVNDELEILWKEAAVRGPHFERHALRHQCVRVSLKRTRSRESSVAISASVAIVFSVLMTVGSNMNCSATAIRIVAGSSATCSASCGHHPDLQKREYRWNLTARSHLTRKCGRMKIVYFEVLFQENGSLRIWSIFDFTVKWMTYTRS